MKNLLHFVLNTDAKGADTEQKQPETEESEKEEKCFSPRKYNRPSKLKQITNNFFYCYFRQPDDR